MSDGSIRILAYTIMPDHIHLLFELGEKLKLGQVIGKLKSLSRQTLADAGLKWQRNYYEHRLRPREKASDYAQYIFMNPYRANLIGRCSEWPHWKFGAGVEFDFMTSLCDGKYPPFEWLSPDWRELHFLPESVGEPL